MQFDHIGVPTTDQRPDEMYVEETKVHVTDPADHPDNIEFLRFESDSPVSDRIREQQHVAFRVDDIDDAIEGEDVLLGPFMATDTLEVVFVSKHGVIFEFMDHKDEDEWFEGEAGDEVSS